jgi:hypothetical protein
MPAGVRMIVGADDGFSLQCPQACCRRDIISVLKRHAEPFCFSIRWVQVEQRVWSIVPVDARLPVEPLDEGGSKSQVCR